MFGQLLVADKGNFFQNLFLKPSLSRYLHDKRGDDLAGLKVLELGCGEDTIINNNKG